MPMPLALVCLLSLQGAAPQPEPSQEKQEPGVQTGTDRGSALRILVTGHVDLHYAYRSEEVDLVASGLNTGTPSATGSAHFWAGRIGIRTDVDVKDLVSGVIELENRSFESGANRPFAGNPTTSQLDIRQ